MKPGSIEKHLWPFGLFLSSLTIYLLCSHHSVSFWDSGELIASGHFLQNSHSPGAPAYLLIIWLLTSPFSGEHIALVTNLFSAFCAASTGVVLYYMSQLIAAHWKSPFLIKRMAGTLSGLTLVACHSVWNAAIVAEVYTCSMLFAMAIFYIALRWYLKEEKCTSWLLPFMFFLLGISIGIHPINFGIIIPIAMIVILKKWRKDHWGYLLGFLMGLAALYAFRNILFHGTIYTFGQLDILLVNQYNAPINTSCWFLCLTVLLLPVIIWGIGFMRKSSFIKQGAAIVFLYFLGLSVYTLPLKPSTHALPFSQPIRNLSELYEYITSSHLTDFQERSLLHGKSYNTPLDEQTPVTKGEEQWVEKEGKYINIGHSLKLNYAKELMSLFPRMSYSDRINIHGYVDWEKLDGSMLEYPINGEVMNVQQVTFMDNVSFFINYQLGWGYMRYLLQNFVGIQNSFPGNGNPMYGNWASGWDVLDSYRIGVKEKTPDHIRKNASRNVYFGIPWIIGIIGLFFLARNALSVFILTLIVFLAFGLGVTLYLNFGVSSLMIRERDYIYLISYAIFCLWIGCGLLALYQWGSTLITHKLLPVLVGLVLWIIVPLQMIVQNWDDHDRSLSPLRKLISGLFITLIWPYRAIFCAILTYRRGLKSRLYDSRSG